MNKSMFLTLLCLLPIDVSSAKEVNTPKESFMQKLQKKKELIKHGAIIALVVSTGLGCGYLAIENSDLKDENTKIKGAKDQANGIIKKMANVFVKVNEIRSQFKDLDNAFERIKDHTKDEKMEGLHGEIVFRSMASRDLEDFEKKFAEFSLLMHKSPHSLEDINQ
mgnify:CR=1 FL=1